MSDQEFYLYRTPKACTFCGGVAAYSPLVEMEEHNVKVYFCSDCRAEYLYFWDSRSENWRLHGNPSSISLYTTINDKMYRWTISSTGDGLLWYVKNPGVPGSRKNSDMEPVKSFRVKEGAVPDITPQNINDKVRTWLIFL